MLAHRLYYGLKPYLPWRLRMTLRRWAARRKRAQYTPSWPIDPSAAQPPVDWPGWPEGKQFAFAITHDVEGPAGLERCLPLVAIEAELGFRSCFNFIPEGPYRVPDSLRAALRSHGCEIGVHDLEHDGRLFASKARFGPKADRINRHLNDWEADGFRGAFMLRNLEWIHDLQVKYDSSTFDTDPFEPQTEAAGTIFPFWIPRVPQEPNGGATPASRTGYVELPYTLPQDSTLFLVLQEATPDIWLRKLDWVAEHGGMALVNIHPDYVQFDGTASDRTYPVAHYRRLLEHVRTRYAGRFWHALPREIARFTTSLPTPPRPPRRKRICMITHSFYESDNRVTRYAESLVNRGDEVDVIALRRSPSTPAQEVIQGVNVHRLQDRFGKTEQNQFSFLWPLLRFLATSSRWVTREHRRQPYDLLHIHNMPDFLVFAGWYPRLKGSRIILDIHDIVPEFYASKFRGGNETLTGRILRWLERRSARFADHVIISNHLWLKKYEARTGSAGKCSVFINNVDTRIFAPQPRTRHDDRIIVLFPGGLQWHQGLDIALRAFRRVSAVLPRAEFHIYGDGNMKPALIALASELGFRGEVKFFEPVRVKEVARLMANSDLGIVPKRADSFGNEAYSTKIMEFMSLGVPVVVSATKIDRFYFDDSVVRFFESGNSEALADAMLDVLQNAEKRERMIAAASEYSERNSWKSRQSDYLALVDSLTTGRVNHSPNSGASVRPYESQTSSCPTSIR